MDAVAPSSSGRLEKLGFEVTPKLCTHVKKTVEIYGVLSLSLNLSYNLSIFGAMTSWQ